MSPIYFRSDLFVKAVQGPAIAGAQVYICNQPADTSDLPPTPLAAIYSDPNGLFLISQPMLTDGFGHADYYAASGTYTEVIAYGGVIQQVYPDQTIGAVVASGVLINNSVITNPNFNNTIPAPPAGYVNVSWQMAGGYVSACVPIGGGGGGVSVEINGGPFSSSTVLNFTNSVSVLFSDLGSGRLTASAVGFLPTPDVKSYASWVALYQGGSGIYSVQNDTVLQSDAGVADSYLNADANNSTSHVMTPNSGNPASVRVNYGGYLFYGSRTIVFKSAASCYNSTAGPIRIWVALTDGDVHTGANPVGFNVLGFVWFSGIANWQCVTANGSSTTIVDSGVAQGITNLFALEVDYTPGVSAVFKINGSVVATITTTLPTTGLMGLYTAVTSTNFGNISALRLAYMYAEAYPTL